MWFTTFYFSPVCHGRNAKGICGACSLPVPICWAWWRTGWQKHTSPWALVDGCWLDSRGDPFILNCTMELLPDGATETTWVEEDCRRRQAVPKWGGKMEITLYNLKETEEGQKKNGGVIIKLHTCEWYNHHILTDYFLLQSNWKNWRGFLLGRLRAHLILEECWGRLICGLSSRREINWGDRIWASHISLEAHK